jgi:hypothetical protein
MGELNQGGYRVPDKINAAHRLDQILREAQAKQGDISTVEVWTQVFRITGSDAPTTAVEVARLVGLLRDQLNEVERKMRTTSVRPQRYESAFNHLSNALDVQTLSRPWNQLNQYLRPEVLDAIGWCADTLPAEEDVIDPDHLAHFEEEVRVFGERIADSDLPDYVKAFILQQVDIIEQAIREYPVTGARAFRRGYVNSFVNFTENQDTFLEREDEEEMQTLRTFWSQLQDYAQKAGPWIAIGQAAARILELTGGS